jgi:hypothetical protein
MLAIMCASRHNAYFDEWKLEVPMAALMVARLATTEPGSHLPELRKVGTEGPRPGNRIFSFPLPR